MSTAVQAPQYCCHLLPYVVMMPADKPWRQLLRTPSRRSSKNSTAAYSSYKATGTSRSYLNSSSPTLRASASLRVVRGEAIRRSSSNSEMESAEIALLADSCLTDIPRSLRTLFRLCSSGIEWRREGLPRPPPSLVAEHLSYTSGRGCAAETAPTDIGTSQNPPFTHSGA